MPRQASTRCWRGGSWNFAAAAPPHPQGVELLDELAGIIRTLDASRIQIIGHTDSSGERLANVALSLARADAVRTYLIRQGIAAERLGTLGAGPDRPLADNATEAGRARNRRIELRVVH